MARLSAKIDKLSEKSIFLILFAYSFFIRLPFFFRDYIDRDESSFILVGQSWVDGFLPYTELWDVKPPLTFFFFAAIIFFFGKSFIAIRFFGVLLVAISSFFSFKITTGITSKKVALGIGLLSVILQSLFGSLQGVMSEHIVMAVLTPAIWLLTFNDIKRPYWFLAGLLIGCAIMIKLNIAYVALFIGLYALFYKSSRKAIKLSFWRALFYGCGAIVIVLAVLVPYYLNDQLLLFWKSVILAPLAYAGARQHSFLKMASFIVPILLLLFIGLRKNYFDLKNRTTFILILSILGVLLSFVKGGRINGHYLIMLYPILLPLIGIFIEKISIANTKKAVYTISIVLFLVPMESYLEYANVVSNKIEKGSFFNGEGIDVPKYLLENNINTKNILFTEYHIGYWILGTNPPTKASTQPSNILKEEMFFAYDNPRKTGLGEIQYIMEVAKPSILVIRKNRRIFDKKKPLANRYINGYLKENYKKLDSVDAALIYQRLE